MSFPIASSGFDFRHALQELSDEQDNLKNKNITPIIQKIRNDFRNQIHDYIRLSFDDGSTIGIGNMWEYLLDTTVSREVQRGRKLKMVEIGGPWTSVSFLASERITQETKDLWREIMKSQNK